MRKGTKVLKKCFLIRWPLNFGHFFYWSSIFSFVVMLHVRFNVTLSKVISVGMDRFEYFSLYSTWTFNGDIKSDIVLYLK